jgi:hypothetical protein
MIRKITRPTTARCTLPMYISFLLGEPNYGIGESLFLRKIFGHPSPKISKKLR